MGGEEDGKRWLGCKINKFIKNELGLLAYSQAILSILSTKCQSQDSTVNAPPGSSNLWICPGDDQALFHGLFLPQLFSKAMVLDQGIVSTLSHFQGY